MATLADAETLLGRFTGAAAIVAAPGVLVAATPAFEERIPVALGASVAVQGARGVAARVDGGLVVLGLLALEGGGWLATPLEDDQRGALTAVSRVVVRRLRRIEATLSTSASAALAEHPAASTAASLREVLAASEEIGGVARQVEAFDTAPRLQRAPACLRTLAADAVALCPAASHTIVAVDVDGDFTVEMDAARLLPALVAILGPLGRVEGGEPGVRVGLSAGDQVRLHLTRHAGPIGTIDGPELDAFRALVVLHGGRVLVDPADGLEVELPAYGVSGALLPPNATVLLVDDDPSARAMMRAVLHRAGFRVLCAANGVEASALLRLHAAELDVIVTDAVLPGRSGLELASEARRVAPHAPVLLVSGHPADLHGGDGLDGVPLLAKPFGARLLAEQVRQLVRRT